MTANIGIADKAHQHFDGLIKSAQFKLMGVIYLPA
jgi:hypothetical protein